MDFHALPRRDLQALCKRNSIRANMTNAAMADALSALPAVDGIEEYVKQPAAEPTPEADPVAKAVTEEEIPPPRGSRVSFNLPEPIMREDEGKEKRGLKRDEHKDTALALGLERCALAEPLVAPATKRRAVESKTETGDVASEAAPVLSTRTRRMAAASKTEAGSVAAETVPAPAPAPTTRGRRQRTVAVVAEEKVLRARRTARRVQVPNTDVQQEEEGEGTQGVTSDVKNIVPAPVSDEGRDEPVDIEEAMNPENEKLDEIIEELSQEEEEISQVPMETATPVDVSEDCTDNLSVQEPQVDVIMQQSKDLPVLLGLVEQVQDAPLQDVAGSGDESLDDEMIHHSNEETETVTVKEEAQAMLKLAEATENLGEVPTVLDEEMIHHSSEETKTVPVKEAQAMLKSAEATENVNEVPAVGDCEEVRSDAKAKEAGSEDGLLLEEKESLAVDEVLHDTAVAVEEEGVVATDKMSQSSATVNVDVEEVVFAVNDLSHVTATHVEVASKENAFTSDLEENEAGTDDGFLFKEKESLAVDEVLHDTDVAVEEEVVAVEEMVFAVNDLSQVTATHVEVAGEESAFTGDLKENEAGIDDGFLFKEKENLAVDEVLHDTDVAVEEEGVVAVEEVVFAVNDLPQVTATHVEVAGEESAFTGDLEENEAGTDDGFLFKEKESLAADEVLDDTDVAVEEGGVVATDKMLQSSATVDVGVEEVVFAVNDLSQVTATHVEVAGEESAFTGDLEENEAGTDDGFLFKEKESLAVDEVLHDTDVAVEEEGVVAADKMSQSSVNVDVEEVVFAVKGLSQVTATHVEVAGEESAFTGDLEENEAGTDDGFLFKEKESLTVDEVLHDTDVAVEEEGVLAIGKMPQSSATVHVDVQKVLTVNYLSQVMGSDVEGASEESAFTSDLPPVFDTARDCSDHSTSPFFAGMFDDDTKSMSIDSVIVEPKVPEEACDVSPCMCNNSNKKNTKSVSVEQKKVKESNKSEAMGNLSLRKLRVKFKETMAVGQENEVKEGKKSLDSIIVEPKVSEEAGDGSLCVYNNSNENNITQSVALEKEEVKESNKFDAMGNLRVKFKETVAAGQENEVKEGMPLDKLSLRKLKIKLKETLIARESREPNRAPLGRLDENAC